MAESWAMNAGRRRNMQAIKNRDTQPELRLRSLLHSRGLRFRVAYRPLPEVRWSADLVFTKARLAVFVDGCFWHACPAHFKLPGRNSDYWQSKIDRNQRRDHEFDLRLREAGWTVVRVWEHEDVEAVAARIEALLQPSGTDPRSGTSV
jgi:DNA mismatch endonuclease (patch repair protein)